MKRRFTALAVVAGLTLSGCLDPTRSGSNQGEAAPPFAACQLPNESGLDDFSYNAIAAAGLAETKKRLGISVTTIEAGSAAQYQPSLSAALAQGCDVLVASGSGYSELIANTAKTHPDQHFLLVGDTFVGDDGKPVTLKNASSLSFDTAQGSFLAGYLAAGVSKSSKVATIGGITSGDDAKIMDGYADGVAAYNKANAAKVTLLGWDKAKQKGTLVGSATDDAKGRAATTKLLESGADVVLPIGGSWSLGAVQAVKAKKGSYAIWLGQDAVDLPDSLGDVVLATVELDASSELADRVAAVENADFKSTPWVGTLANEGVSLTRNDDLTSVIPGALVKQLSDLETKSSPTSPTSPSSTTSPSATASPTTS